MTRFHLVSLPILVAACVILQRLYALQFPQVQAHTNALLAASTGIILWLFVLRLTSEKQPS